MKLKFRLTIFFILLLWNLGIHVGIFQNVFPNSIIALPIINKCYSLVCHQQDFKLLSFLEINSMVCSRCAGIYFGAFLISLFMLFQSTIKELKINYLLIASIPMFIDVILYNLELYTYQKSIAFLTGFLFGSVGIYYFYIGLNSLLLEKKVGKD